MKVTEYAYKNGVCIASVYKWIREGSFPYETHENASGIITVDIDKPISQEKLKSRKKVGRPRKFAEV